MKKLTFKIFGFFLITILLSVSGITKQLNSEPNSVLNSETFNFCNENFFSEVTEIQTNHIENLYNFLNTVVSNSIANRSKASCNRVKTHSVKFFHQNENSFHILISPKIHIQKSAFADLQYLKFLRITKMLC